MYCTICKIDLPESAFVRNAATRTGLATYCKKCNAAAVRRSRLRSNEVLWAAEARVDRADRALRQAQAAAQKAHAHVAEIRAARSVTEHGKRLLQEADAAMLRAATGGKVRTPAPYAPPVYPAPPPPAPSIKDILGAEPVDEQFERMAREAGF